MIDLRLLLNTAIDAAKLAGVEIMKVYRGGDVQAGVKRDRSPVTIADRSAHRLINECLATTKLPVLSEEGREIAYGERKSWDYFWLIDPLDGTKEFINKNGEFTINIALVREDRPVAGVVYAPCMETIYYGAKETGVFKNEKGKLIQLTPLPERKLFKDLVQSKQVAVVASRSHPSPETSGFIDQLNEARLISLGSSLKFMLLLENKADIYPRFGTTMEWDTAAAHAMLNASNRGVYTTDLSSELVYNKQDLQNPFFIAF